MSDLPNTKELARQISDQGQLLARIDERTLTLVKEMSEIRREMVTRPEIRPIKAIAYGLAGLMLSGVVAAILQLVLQKS